MKLCKFLVRPNTFSGPNLERVYKCFSSPDRSMESGLCLDLMTSKSCGNGLQFSPATPKAHSVTEKGSCSNSKLRARRVPEEPGN